MKTWTTLALHGPNRWSSRSVLELHAAPGIALRPVSASVPADIDRLLRDFLDSGQYSTTHPQSVSCARGALSQIGAATSHGALWGSIAHWMTAMAGVPSRYLPVLPWQDATGTNGMLAIAALEMEEERLSLRAYEVASEMIDEMEAKGDYPIASKFRELFDYADDVRLGPSSRAILDAASERSIPFYRLTSGSLCQLGEGRWQRRIWTAETDATSAIAESIASDKDLTKRLLRHVGVPIPIGRMVTDPDDAWSAAQEVGFPVVVKPRNANHQRGISIELTERDEIHRAYHWAIEDGQTQDVMVEQYARGQHHRLLVVGGRMVAASRGHVETVTGDGIHTVEQLIDEVNRDPLRGEAYTDPLSIIKMVAATHIELAKQGLAADSVPETGRVVLIHRTGDLTTDCTEEVHPETARQAVLAARVVGLDIAGLDVLAEDIRQPLASQRGAIVEVNAGPSLSPHVAPLFGKPQPVGRAIIDLLFPSDLSACVPIVCFVASHGTDAISLLNAWRQRATAAGAVAGAVEEDGVRVGEEWIPLPEASVPQRVRALLTHPFVDTIAISCSLQAFARQACPVPRIDRLILVPTQENTELWFHCEDAWRTLGHAIHSQTEIEWNNTPSILRDSIEDVWRRTSTLSHLPRG